jgi:hypothetical protein
MNLAQALGVAAAALVVGLYPQLSGLGAASAQETVAQSQALTREAIRTATLELADLMEASDVFPDQARRYAVHLRTRAAAGVYDEMREPALFASTLQAELAPNAPPPKRDRYTAHAIPDATIHAHVRQYL